MRYTNHSQQLVIQLVRFSHSALKKETSLCTPTNQTHTHRYTFSHKYVFTDKEQDSAQRAVVGKGPVGEKRESGGRICEQNAFLVHFV